DIPLLVRHFLAKFGKRLGKRLREPDADTLRRLAQYAWPGNIRELENLVRRLAALYPQETISEALIETELGLNAPLAAPALAGPAPAGRGAAASATGESFAADMERSVGELFRSFGAEPPPVGLYHRVVRELEAPLIAATLAVTRGNQIKAAEILGLNRNTLRKKIRDLDLKAIRAIR
ncbi:MAG TPA: helix-turn-helix domain-containing protein, partial [Roseiarcus sp.]|nr:helix-turn-helix domain-containing protein [Roseiarcus sp.]